MTLVSSSTVLHLAFNIPSLLTISCIGIMYLPHSLRHYLPPSSPSSSTDLTSWLPLLTLEKKKKRKTHSTHLREGWLFSWSQSLFALRESSLASSQFPLAMAAEMSLSMCAAAAYLGKRPCRSAEESFHDTSHILAPGLMVMSVGGMCWALWCGLQSQHWEAEAEDRLNL